MYDPIVGRWLQEDPIDIDAGDPNFYRYVGNNPTNATDPSGLAIEKNGICRSATELADELRDVFNEIAQERKTGHILDNFTVSAKGTAPVDRMKNRFVYTRKGGFVDLKHYFRAAHYKNDRNWSNFTILKAGLANEEVQAFRGETSAFGPEDLPSNRYGLEFAIASLKEETPYYKIPGLFVDYCQNQLGGIVDPYKLEDWPEDVFDSILKSFNDLKNFSDKPILLPFKISAINQNTSVNDSYAIDSRMDLRPGADYKAPKPGVRPPDRVIYYKSSGNEARDDYYLSHLWNGRLRRVGLPFPQVVVPPNL